MFPLFVAVLFLGCSPDIAETERKYNALRFGQTTGDYIQWAPVDMSSATTQFSVCSWLRKRYPALYPVVLHYYPHSNGMLIGANGYHNYVVGTNLDVHSEYNEPDGHWFHVCMTWGTSNYRATVYLNGEQVGSRVTRQREVRTGGKMCLGNNAYSTKYSDHTFGGDLYKMNIYNRVLSQSEIRSMSSDMCSTEEERVTANTILKWEEILLKERTGSVTEIASGCHDEQQRNEIQQRPVVMVETEIETEQESQELTKSKTNITLDDILRRLQNTERELAKTKANFSQRLENVTISLTSTQDELDSTKQELTEAKNNLNKSLTSTLIELDTTKQELERSDKKLTNLNISLTSTQDELNSTKQELAVVKKNLTQQLENVTLVLTSTLATLNNTEKDLAETKTGLERSGEKLESVTMSLNHTLEQLEAAKKEKGRSKWDVLFSDKFLNNKLTREISQELKSTGNMLGLFVGMNITEELISYLKSYHEEDTVCLNTGN